MRTAAVLMQRQQEPAALQAFAPQLSRDESVGPMQRQ